MTTGASQSACESSTLVMERLLLVIKASLFLLALFLPLAPSWSSDEIVPDATSLPSMWLAPDGSLMDPVLATIENMRLARPDIASQLEQQIYKKVYLNRHHANIAAIGVIRKVTDSFEDQAMAAKEFGSAVQKENAESSLNTARRLLRYLERRVPRSEYKTYNDLIRFGIPPGKLPNQTVVLAKTNGFNALDQCKQAIIVCDMEAFQEAASTLKNALTALDALVKQYSQLHSELLHRPDQVNMLHHTRLQLNEARVARDFLRLLVDGAKLTLRAYDKTCPREAFRITRTVQFQAISRRPEKFPCKAEEKGTYKIEMVVSVDKNTLTGKGHYSFNSQYSAEAPNPRYVENTNITYKGEGAVKIVGILDGKQISILAPSQKHIPVSQPELLSAPLPKPIRGFIPQTIKLNATFNGITRKNFMAPLLPTPWASFEIALDARRSWQSTEEFNITPEYFHESPRKVRIKGTIFTRTVQISKDEAERTSESGENKPLPK